MSRKPLLLPLAALLLAACGPGTPPPPKGITHIYTMRGEITEILGPDNPEGALRIHHEAVNDFRDTLDQPDPMNAMTMPFTLAPGVSLDTLKVGDKIRFEWEVNWDAQIHRIKSITKLPPDTVLTYAKATTATAPTTRP
jgi:Cu/Ag efflux protein CusF